MDASALALMLRRIHLREGSPYARAVDDRVPQASEVERTPYGGPACRIEYMLVPWRAAATAGDRLAPCQ